MMQLAKALEQVANINFVWVVRPPLGFDITTSFEQEWLGGFIERVVDDRKRINCGTMGTQMEILSHKSVGSFLTPAGGTSVWKRFHEFRDGVAMESGFSMPSCW
ncbi:UDP-glycosyltransferase 92A1 [Camellia lanceoleosa]|uniref:UDP-glycosyltransferase 92A1 n=1 Tax=Camellia lanceoleosa TaxID=1840588 RepID=A0ACC0F6B5_9ERIC|nr:UDP-glycosyltransferase 92A1 [Camellia lanceoleosa]